MLLVRTMPPRRINVHPFLDKLSPKQYQAATFCGQDLVINAGAGAGKTRTLVARYLYQHLELGYDLNEIVAITFTNKAAAEMQDRIRAELTALGKSTQGLDTAYISTFHSFCGRILREFSAAAGLDPEFGILDETESSVLLYRAVKERINKGLAQELADYDLSLLALTLTNGIPSKLIPELVRAYRLWQGTGLAWPEAEALSLVVDESQLGQAKAQVEACLGQVEGCRGSVSKRSHGAIERALAAWGDGDFESDAKILEATAALQDINSKAEPLGTALANLKASASVLQGIVADLHAQPVTAAFIRVLKEINASYTQAKDRANALDFDDVILTARKLFAQPQVNQALSRRFRAILVDEYQDTNTLQKELIDLIRPVGSLTVVGDPKQSIYRFRGAEVEVFAQTAAEIQERGGKVIDLTENYRSRGEIIAFCNDFFASLLPCSSPYGVGYDQIEAKRSNDVKPRIELLTAIVDKKTSVGETRSQEAKALAYRIQEMVARQERLVEGETTRPVTYQDIAMLFRSTTDLDIYQSALKELGIPTVNLARSDFFPRQEITDLLACLRVVANPEDEASLAHALHSPLFGLGDPELFRLKQDYGSLAKALFADLTGAEVAQFAVGFTQARKLFAQFVPIAHRIGPSYFVEQILSQTGYQDQVLAYKGGEQAYANLTKFQEFTEELERAGLVELGEFLSYVDEAVQSAARQEEAPLVSEEEDAVKLLTIHGAKGLEFKVVFLVDGDRKLEHAGFPPVVRFDVQDGFGLKFFLEGQSISTGKYTAIANRAQEADYEEAKRVFYVGVTRAEDYLILSGIRGKDRTEEMALVNQGKSWLDWLEYLAANSSEICRRDILEYLAAAETQAEAQAQCTSTQVVSTDEVASTREPPAISGQAESPAAAIAVDWGREILSVGVSDLLLLNSCPRQFYYQRILGVPQRPEVFGAKAEKRSPAVRRTDPILRGNLAHLACSRLYGGEDLYAVLTGCAVEFGLDPQKESELLVEVQRLLTNYRDSRLFNRISGAQRIFSEEPFVYELANLRISGTIDKLALYQDGRALLVDYKTSRISADEVSARAVHYRLQLQLYALAMQAQFGVEPRNMEVGIYFLVPGVYEPICEPKVGEIAEMVSGFRQYLISGEIDAYPRNTTNCAHCSYAKYCLG